MKQRTTFEATNLLPVSRPHIRRRLLSALRPEGARVPLDLDLTEIVAELESRMIDWESPSTDLRLARVSDQRRSQSSQGIFELGGIED